MFQNRKHIQNYPGLKMFRTIVKLENIINIQVRISVAANYVTSFKI